MAAAPATARAGEVPCPDPSVHEQSNRLSEQASAAALLATNTNNRANNNQRDEVLGPDGRLSSKGAAASLKYARPQDLPSFPSHGHAADSAGRAATLAKDFKMRELWQPEMSSAGSRAAILAHRDGGKLDLWQPAVSQDGHSAAVLAMRAAQGLSPNVERGTTPDGHQRALKAANLSINRSGAVTPAQSSSYPDAENAGTNALSAATSVHRKSVSSKAAPDGWDSEANQAARVTHLHMDPEMFGEHPPVKVGEEEERHQAALRASAVSMAKQMYDIQNRAALGSDSSGREPADAAPTGQQRDMKQEALRYINLQDAAHRLAQERLAKVDRNMEAARYREYYGYPDRPTSPRKSITSRLSVSGRRRRAGSDAELEDSDDEETARRIRSQMSQLSSGLNSVDEKKRQDDRARLMAAAEAKVHAQMHDMDNQVFLETGKIPPAMMEEWEAKAKKRAQEERETAAQHQGKTHIGGGKFIDQSEIEAIAAARLKPTLDEINDTAEKRRQRDQELREEKEEQERLRREEKAKKAQEKAEAKRVKNEEKAAKHQEREEAKVRKSEEKRKSRETKREDATAVPVSEEPEDDRKTKRAGVFGKLASRLRGDKKEEDEGTVDEKPNAAPTVAGPAATGAVAADAVGHKEEGPEFGPHPAVEPPAAAVLETKEDNVATASGTLHDPNQAVLADDLEDPAIARNEDELGEKGRQFVHDHAQDADIPTTGATIDGPADVPAVIDPEHARSTGEVDPCPQLDEAEDKSLIVTNGPHRTDTANMLDPQVAAEPRGSADMPPSLPVAIAGETTAAAAESEAKPAATTGSEAKPAEQVTPSTKGDETGPAPNTIGPHSADVANILDPRVRPHDPEDLKTRERQEGKEREHESKGFRGFLSKFRGRKDHPGKISRSKYASTNEQSTTSAEKKPEVEAAALDSPLAVPSTSGGAAIAALDHHPERHHDGQHVPEPASGAQTDATGTHTTAAAVAVADAPGSPSSFTRHQPPDRVADDDVSDVSSGLDEEAFTRGRTTPGQMKAPGLLAKLGLSSSKAEDGPESGLHSRDDGANDLAVVESQGSKNASEGREANEVEKFEEARDHFDESLAPPPKFTAGVAEKSTRSPVRETRFKEDV